VRVIVTGGAGFIGGHVARALHARGDVVTVVDDLSSGKRENIADGIRFVEMDIRSLSLAARFADVKPDAVLHFAAQVSVLASLRDPEYDYSVNFLGGHNVLKAAVGIGARAFVNVSTGIVYGEPDSDVEFPLVETTYKKIPFPYSQTKFAFELMLAGSVSKRAISAATLRPGNVYGPRQDPHGEAGVVAIFSQRLIAGEPLVIHGEGSAVRDYVYVDDVVNAALLALDGLMTNPEALIPGTGNPPEPGSDSHSLDDIAFNIGTGVGTNVIAIADALTARARDRGIAPRPREYSAPRAREVPRIELCSDKARRMLDWSPRTPLSDGLARTFDWFLDENTRLQR